MMSVLSGRRYSPIKSNPNLSSSRTVNLIVVENTKNKHKNKLKKKKKKIPQVLLPKRFGVQVLESDTIVVEGLVEMRVKIFVDSFTAKFGRLEIKIKIIIKINK